MRFGVYIFTLSIIKNNYMEKEVVEIDNRDLIQAALNDDRRSIKYLSDMTKIPYMTLYSCLAQRLFRVSEDNLKKINETLGTDIK